MYVTDRHDMTLAVKLALNPNTTNQPYMSIKGSETLITCLFGCMINTSSLLYSKISIISIKY